MRIGLVVQRYGAGVVGGAEAHARSLARHLRDDLGWSVEVFTTTAHDYQSWKNHYRAGTETVDGLPVHRFPVEGERSPLFPAYRRLAPPMIAALGAGEESYYRLQGPYSPALLEALDAQASAFDRFIFFTYLYHPTVYGLPKVGAKAALVPTLHDEAPAWFPATKALLRAARAVLVNSEAERELALRVAPDVGVKTHVVGVGLTLAEPGAPLLPEPYLLYLGRLSAGKGVDRLVEHFAAYAAKNPRTPLKLVLAGERDPGFTAGKNDPRVIDRGAVSEQDKATLLAHAAVVVSASPLESLSLMALEAAHLRRPLLLTASCAIFRYYAEVLPTALAFTADDFAAKLDTLVNTAWDAPENATRLAAAKAWVDERYSWARVTAAYARYL